MTLPASRLAQSQCSSCRCSSSPPSSCCTSGANTRVHKQVCYIPPSLGLNVEASGLFFIVNRSKTSPTTTQEKDTCPSPRSLSVFCSRKPIPVPLAVHGPFATCRTWC
uniref:Uncharacterized protein n=1 Tax=Anopheles arabiensis TaxID=7173 RepID=A0A182HNF7_ANOAR